MLLFLACAHSPDVVTPPALDGADVAWFDLRGTDRIDLIESCARSCPRDEAGVPVASLTTWAVDWTWTRQASEPCEVVGATLDVDVDVELPRWDPPAEADPALVAEWDRYMTALRRHEQGHIDLVHAVAGTTSGALAGTPCDTADATGAGVLDALRGAQSAYDVETGNGHRQGADFWKIDGRAQAWDAGVR